MGWKHRLNTIKKAQNVMDGNTCIFNIWDGNTVETQLKKNKTKWMETQASLLYGMETYS